MVGRASSVSSVPLRGVDCVMPCGGRKWATTPCFCGPAADSSLHWRAGRPGKTSIVNETVIELVDAHRGSRTSPEDTIRRSYQRIRDHTDAAIFITLRDEAGALSDARPLSARDKTAMPLFGVPVAVKDNIDAEGLPTTAACPAFSYTPIGVRSPYGVPRNPHRAELIPDESGSGSAIALFITSGYAGRTVTFQLLRFVKVEGSDIKLPPPRARRSHAFH
jgi:hypothetical protein